MLSLLDPNRRAIRSRINLHGIYGNREIACSSSDEENVNFENGTLDLPSIGARLKTCCANRNLMEGKRLHSYVIRHRLEQTTFLSNFLMQMYGKCGCLQDARDIFGRLQRRNLFSWNIMIRAYTQNAQFQEAFQLFSRMSKPDVVSWNALISGFAQYGKLEEAHRLFLQMPQRDMASWNSIISGYVQQGQVDTAFKFFKDMPDHDIISCNTMLAGFSRQGRVKEALKIFNEMSQRDVISWTAMLVAYTQKNEMAEALKLFQKMPERNIVSWNAMVAGYVQKGELVEALELFLEMPRRNVISWTTMIMAYTQQGLLREALQLFEDMMLEGMRPDQVTFVSVLDACAKDAALTIGKDIQDHIMKFDFWSDVVVQTSILNMYARSGNLDNAREVFDQMPHRNLASWNVMIAAYAQHGYGREAMQKFQSMQLENIMPNELTISSVLAACSHAGLVDEGHHCFVSTTFTPGILPALEHYTSIVDHLGRLEQLDNAEDLINSMPFQPDAALWIALLGACKTHADVKRGEHAAYHLFKLRPGEIVPYILLSNIYATAGRWHDVSRLRKVVQILGLKQEEI